MLEKKEQLTTNFDAKIAELKAQQEWKPKWLINLYDKAPNARKTTP